MREIKFRAYSNELKRMENQPYIECLGGEASNVEFDINGNYETVDDAILMQYTGLKDKNGVEIYEGDVVKGVSANEFSMGNVQLYEVAWGVDSYYPVGTNFSMQELFNYCDDNLEVIGNIHENPELIGE